MELRDLFKRRELNELAKKMAGGDQEAARMIYGELADKVFGFCLTRARNRAIAEDLTQEIFMKLVANIEQFDAKKGDFVSWFWVLARNAVIDHARNRKETSFTDLGDAEESDGSNQENIAAHDPTESYGHRLALKKVTEFVAHLPPEERELFELRFVADLPYGQMAKLTGRQEGALRVATMRLKQKIQDNFGGMNYV